MFLPKGFQTITPYIFCDEPHQCGEFLSNAFGASEIGRTVHEGVIVNLQMQIGTVTMMISQADDRYHARPAAFYIYVADADASMASALAAGATLEMEVMDTSYDDRQGGVVDPFGNIWWVSQRLIDEPYFGATA